MVLLFLIFFFFKCNNWEITFQNIRVVSQIVTKLLLQHRHRHSFEEEIRLTGGSVHRNAAYFCSPSLSITDVCSYKESFVEKQIHSM